MNLKWLRLVTAVFLSAILLMGCNNDEEPIEDPADATDPDTTDENNVVPDSEEPIEDPADATDPDTTDENNVVPDSEEPVEDPADATDPDTTDENK
ncbi:hypothetical protein PGC35_19475 [Psychrobacillus sp. PGGUH221]|uniref:hypothetical protein n=1 Tax=Psychrobacillus sp. PGGUH221 TaxID=3020058 RepID=UPI0035C67920